MKDCETQPVRWDTLIRRKPIQTHTLACDIKVTVPSFGNDTDFTLVWIYTRKCLLTFKSSCSGSHGSTASDTITFEASSIFSFLSKWPHTCNTLMSTNATTHIKNLQLKWTVSTLCIHRCVHELNHSLLRHSEAHPASHPGSPEEHTKSRGCVSPRRHNCNANTQHSSGSRRHLTVVKCSRWMTKPTEPAGRAGNFIGFKVF